MNTGSFVHDIGVGGLQPRRSTNGIVMQVGTQNMTRLFVLASIILAQVDPGNFSTTANPKSPMLLN